MKLGVDRVKEIVISLRNFSHLDEADLKLVDIHKGIDNTLMLLKHRCYRSELGLKIEVIKEYGNLPLVECYPGQLNQVLINILSNAIDALEADFAERSPSDNYQIRISTKLVDSEKISISIADNGLGIPEAVQQHIFDPFFTTKTVGKGKGMGLAISYQIITEKHQGSLECLSQISRGSEFVITIPIAQKQISIIPRNTASMTSASLSNQTIG
jgi:signal transduction histidine kinase